LLARLQLGEPSFVFQTVAMACIARYAGSAVGGGSGSEGHERGGSERTESVRLSDVGSHGKVDDVTDQGSRT
jgi:hypothetical protein